MLPNVLGIGCAKAGTTSLAKVLLKSDAVHFSKKKELHFWDQERFHAAKLPLYASHFLSTKKIRMEFTPSYIMDRYARFRIKRYLGADTRFVVIMRDPVYRAYSHYWHAIKNWTEDSHWVRKRGYPVERFDFETAVNSEFERMVFDPYHPRHLSYVAKGLYHAQLARWTEVFPKEQIYLIVFEQLVETPSKCIHDLSDWLGVKLNAEDFPKINAQTGGSLSYDTYSRHFELYREDIAKLAANYNVDVSRWKFRQPEN